CRSRPVGRARLGSGGSPARSGGRDARNAHVARGGARTRAAREADLSARDLHSSGAVRSGRGAGDHHDLQSPYAATARVASRDSIRQGGTRMKSRLQVALLVATIGLAACSTTFDGLEDTPEARGKRAFINGNLGLAITHYQTALDRAPDSIEALNGLAASYDRLGRFDVAQRYYDRALVLDRRASQTLNNVGYSYLLQGKHEV